MAKNSGNEKEGRKERKGNSGLRKGFFSVASLVSTLKCRLKNLVEGLGRATQEREGQAGGRGLGEPRGDEGQGMGKVITVNRRGTYGSDPTRTEW